MEIKYLQAIQNIQRDPNFVNSSSFLHDYVSYLEDNEATAIPANMTTDLANNSIGYDYKFADFVDLASEMAKISKRGRFNFMLHQSFEEDFQCLVNAVDRNSYVPPHQHTNAEDRRETFTVVRGHFWIIEFDVEGQITKKVKLDADDINATKTYEIETGIIHTVVSDGPFVTLELKQHLKKGAIDLVTGKINEIGGYKAETDKVFPSWAPSEKDFRAQDYNNWLLQEVLNS